MGGSFILLIELWYWHVLKDSKVLVCDDIVLIVIYLQGGDPSLVYTIGCIDAALGLVETQLPIVGGIAIGICFVLVLSAL